MLIRILVGFVNTLVTELHRFRVSGFQLFSLSHVIFNVRLFVLMCSFKNMEIFQEHKYHVMVSVSCHLDPQISLESNSSLSPLPLASLQFHLFLTWTISIAYLRLCSFYLQVLLHSVFHTATSFSSEKEI